MSSRGCLNNPNVFCYICGCFVLQKQRQEITAFVKNAYFAYFGVKLVPMVWWEPKNHGDDCYFFCLKIEGYNAKNKQGIVYPNIPSAMRPVPHGPEVAVPIPTDVLQSVSSESDRDSSSDNVSDAYQAEDISDKPEVFTQSEINDLVRDLNLPKESTELLGSRLKSKKLLSKGAHFSWYR
ncbi:hypothetical protein Hamer_G017501, partial [Homarus americanus]